MTSTVSAATTSHYEAFHTQLEGFLRPEQRIEDLSRRIAYSTDASFYSMIPRLVLKLNHHHEVRRVLALANRWSVPVTFRAAGTSLSGQAVTESVLILLSDHWQQAEILDDGKAIKLQPGLIGARVNQLLAPYQRKIGPDPASINTCKIGGIAANNASGMCCGVKNNSYHTLKDMMFLLADGTCVDTRSRRSVGQFRRKHEAMLSALSALRDEVRNNPALSERIRHQFRLKNTMGYGLNALLDYDDPLDILTHLLIGSEGTLGFIADITLATIAVPQHKATGLYLFNSPGEACALIPVLQQHGAEAVELMDSRALLSVAGLLSPFGELTIAAGQVALLIELSAPDQAGLNQALEELTPALDSARPVCPFTGDMRQAVLLWNIRKGLFPAVGAVRETGTTVIIEDVAFVPDELACGIAALEALFDQYGYDEAIIFGHALDGNLHFVFTQAFDTSEQVQRYDAFMQDVAALVTQQFNGTLKAEHGTGRNMAPFIVHQWGADGLAIMQQIKQIIDPDNILNPGVIINQDDQAHIQHLKRMPAVDPIVDKCIECGFCEPQCPSRQLTLTPRQRIALMRRAAALPAHEQAEVTADFSYLGEKTCAATGLCATSCPVGIDTGAWIKSLRHQQTPLAAQALADDLASEHAHYRRLLNLASKTTRYLPDSAVSVSSRLLRKMNHQIPVYYKQIPAGASTTPPVSASFDDKVVYITGCPNRLFDAPSGQTPLPQVVTRLLNKARTEVILASDNPQLCCGQNWESKGNQQAAQQYQHAMTARLMQLTENGRWPVIFDTSPCALSLQAQPELSVYELSQYLLDYALPRLSVTPTDEPVMLHRTCSSLHLDEGLALTTLAHQLSRRVIIPPDIQCCGFAGDKGLHLPELNASALASLASQIPDDCQRGFSNSRTCEIGLSKAGGVPYQHIVYLLDEVSKPLPTETTS
ncbi:FAD-binding and (Fe-S)-binding domain-containing protein [Salinimonas lutimaris]|uniref:FAD-binding and (Fe-S)-binding domain-containing protein n=1 Tax=Salinimonas lutimaris TaxID=914153 RepID=UPI0010C0942A|nr:FAD-binding and (Fe-S)-binding domain-containing protein [Salinimonas lutimaris]